MIEAVSLPRPHASRLRSHTPRTHPHVVLDDPAELAHSVAMRMVTIIREKTAGGGRAVLGLATGSTPIGVYRELIHMHRDEGLSFADVVSFNLDEYYAVEPASIHSYHRFMWENLFSHVDIDPRNVHIPDGRLSRDEIPAFCNAYEAEIQQAGSIDFQLLGIGKTGHIGFNEPGSGAGSRTRLRGRGGHRDCRHVSPAPSEHDVLPHTARRLARSRV